MGGGQQTTDSRAREAFPASEKAQLVQTAQDSTGQEDPRGRRQGPVGVKTGWIHHVLSQFLQPWVACGGYGGKPQPLLSSPRLPDLLIHGAEHRSQLYFFKCVESGFWRLHKTKGLLN